MKNIANRLLMFSILIFTAATVGCASGDRDERTALQPASTQPMSDDDQITQGDFNTALAEELGADQYGMRQYVIAFLKAGPTRAEDQATAVKLQQAHMANISRMAEEGKLVVAGPFIDGGDLRGIYIFAVKTIEEAQALTETDPAIQAGQLEMELRPWYGSAALMQVNDIHATIARERP